MMAVGCIHLFKKIYVYLLGARYCLGSGADKGDKSPIFTEPVFSGEGQEVGRQYLPHGEVV